MKIKVNFDPTLGMNAYELNLPNSETVQSLQVHLSLSFQSMDACIIKYKGNALKNKKQKLSDIFHSPQVEIDVVRMNDYEGFQTSFDRNWLKTKTVIQKNEKAVGILLGLFIILFLIAIG